jgi:hypothetical protein
VVPGSPRRKHVRPATWVAVALLLAVTGLLQTGSAASASPEELALPSPLKFVSYLDLECFKTDPYLPPAPPIVTRHLNPVLAGLPVETVWLGEREQLCVPVAKNDLIAPPEVLSFVKYVDLSCYRIDGQAVDWPLTLTHLNPLLAGLPPRDVLLTAPVQLCVPVIKNGNVPPPEIYNLVAFIDLKCYLEEPPTALNKNLTLTHLNPVLAQLPPTSGTVTYNRQLCVPVQKNDQEIPPDVLKIVQYIDLEKYDFVSTAELAPYTLKINHINPLLTGLPTEVVTITDPLQLALPVAKNGLIPPA